MILFGCNSGKKNVAETLSKISDKDYFKSTIVKSQYFKINASEDTTFESQKGNLLMIPEGSFLDKNGNVVKDSIQIEFAEASDLDEMVLSNLIIQESSKIYESSVAIYINATKDGEQLRINPNNTIYLELPSEKQLNMYKGTRDSIGNMRWKEKYFRWIILFQCL